MLFVFLQILAKRFHCMRKLCVLVTVLLLVSFARGQSPQRGKLTVTVENEQRQAIENVTIEILRKKDSVLVKAGLTDKLGIADLENVRLGDYLLKLSAINYTTQYSTFSLTTENSAIALPKITLQQKSTQLGGVTVTGRKPFIQKLSRCIA